MNIEIRDDILSDYDYRQIEGVFIGPRFPWYFMDNLNVSKENAINPNAKSFLGNYYFHNYLFYYQGKTVVAAEEMNLFTSFCDQLGISVEKLWRVKANLYPRTQKKVHHLPHRDYDPGMGYRTALYYVNTNNGYTKFDGTSKTIKSKKNRVALFDGSNPHHSTTPTDVNYRLTINFDYRL